MKKYVVLFALLIMAACEEDALSPPEIWIDLSPVNLDVRVVDPELGPRTFDLQLTNRGEETLKIESMVVRGDQNCAFSFDGPDTLVMGENGSAFIRGYYNPIVTGEDQIALEVNSNAHNFATLVVPVCGKAVPLGTTEPIDPPICQVPPPGQSNCVE
ncbi:MAG: hypothetical protein QNJ97_13685 [Myxococcota bacterium]|nr:hypothetical protein [Myxococcota bacterium]